MKKYFLKPISLVIMLVAIFAVVGCSSQTAKADAGLVIKGTEKNFPFQVTLPKDWVEDKKLNAEALSGASLKSKELYFLIIPEEIKTFPANYSFAEYAGLIAQNYAEKLKDPQITNAKDIKLAGYEAAQFYLEGDSDGTRIKFLITLVKTENHYTQLLSWSGASEFNSALPIFEGIANSFSKAK